MKTEKFIVFHHSEDGETDCSLMTEKEILDLVQEQNDDDFEVDFLFLNELPKCGWNYCGECYLIIKGEIIIPKLVEKVTKWEL